MSLFGDDISSLKKSVQFFNSLPNDRKIIILTNIGKPQTFTQDEQTILTPLIQAIQNDSIRNSQTQIANKLVEIGMEQTYAVLLVTNVIKEIPSAEYQFKIISDMGDEQFRKLLPEFVHSVWVDKDSNVDTMKTLKLTNEQFTILVDFFRTLMNQLLRRDTSEKIIKQVLKGGNFTDDKIDVILNTIKVNSDVWKNMLIFSNTQDLTSF